MAIIGLEFFAIPEEWPGLLEASDGTFASWKTLVRSAPTLSLDTVLPQAPLAWSVDRVDRLCLTVGRPDLSAKSAHELLLLNPDALVVDVGRQEKDSLFASALRARTEDPESLKRWQAIARGLKKRLKSGLWVKNPETGAKSFSKSFWYSEGAGQFSLGGGALRPVAGWNVLSVREPA